jgi:hypothetical protein
MERLTNSSKTGSKSNLYSSSASSKLGFLSNSNPNLLNNSALGLSPDIIDYYSKKNKGNRKQSEEEVKMHKVDSKKKLTDDEDIPIDVFLLGERVIHDNYEDSLLGDDEQTELESEESERNTDGEQTESSEETIKQDNQVKRSLEMV